MREKRNLEPKIRMGISSCLLGNPVRYDGGDKLDHFLKDSLGELVHWVPVCPEAECGLPVPREAMRLEGRGKHLRLMTVDTHTDKTVQMRRWIEKKLKALEKEDLCGFVFKNKSPSCCPGRGLFAAAVAGHFPSLPIEDESRLRDPGVRARFFQRACRYFLSRNPSDCR